MPPALRTTASCRCRSFPVLSQDDTKSEGELCLDGVTWNLRIPRENGRGELFGSLHENIVPEVEYRSCDGRHGWDNGEASIMDVYREGRPELGCLQHRTE